MNEIVSIYFCDDVIKIIEDYLKKFPFLEEIKIPRIINFGYAYHSRSESRFYRFGEGKRRQQTFYEFPNADHKRQVLCDIIGDKRITQYRYCESCSTKEELWHTFLPCHCDKCDKTCNLHLFKKNDFVQ